MGRRKRYNLSEHRCCEHCNNCTIDDNCNYICNQNAVIEGYMPTENYYWCGGKMFRKKESEEE